MKIQNVSHSCIDEVNKIGPYSKRHLINAVSLC